MLQTYITEIAVTTLAAKLLHRNLIENHYALHGALPSMRRVSLGKIAEAEGIEGVPAKADDFKFGRLCSGAIQRRLGDQDTKTRISQDATIVRNLFLRKTPEELDKEALADLRENLPIILRAMLKRAQIRTHTNKPGGEDINVWLDRFYRLQQEYDATIAALVKVVITPETQGDMSFFNRNDNIVVLALAKKAPSKTALDEVIAIEPICAIGKILQDIVMDPCC